jgi:tetratricopeptide (TPR) repeat protein
VRYYNSIPSREGDESNKLTVYVVANDAAVRRLFGAGGAHVAGFYQGRASGSVAFTPAQGGDPADINALQPQIVLFHEYTHHLMLANFDTALPAWYAEGYPEFLSTARFEKDFVWLGAPAQHRAYDLLLGSELGAEQLFSLDQTKKMRESQTAGLYARGWLLTHYLMIDPKRAAQLNAYLIAINDGTPGVEAARAAFGDLNALNRALSAYLHKSTMAAYKIPLTRLAKPTVSLRPLSPGERELITLRMRSDRGVNHETAQPILTAALPIAERYPKDAMVQGWFAEMALDAGRNDLADVAADRALAIDPRSSQALVYKAQVHLRRARDAKVTDPQVWREARSWLLRANKLDTNDAYALMLYYSSFGMAGTPPTDNAKAALSRAHELVPQDSGLAFAYATQMLLDDKRDEARVALRPLAYSAHSSPDNAAARLLAALAEGKTGKQALASLGDAGIAIEE